MLKLVLFLSVLSVCVGLKVAIIHIHGILEHYSLHGDFKKIIERETGIPVRFVDGFNFLDSLAHMKIQVKSFKAKVQTIAAQYDKVIAVGYSQGGLIWRGIIEDWDNHNVDMFISIASPQHGIYGAPGMILKIFPFLEKYSKTNLFQFAYSFFGQTLSFFNYFLDPTHYKLYLRSSSFLTELNNEVGSEGAKKRRKENFLKLRKLVLIGGAGEDVVTPWQSTLFGYYTKKGFGSEPIPMEETRLYKEDLFGLQTLASRTSSAVTRCRYDGLTHLQFRSDLGMLRKCIIPELQEYRDV